MKILTKGEKIAYAMEFARDRKRLGITLDKSYIQVLDMWIIFIVESDTVLIDDMTEHEASLLLEELNKLNKATS